MCVCVCVSVRVCHWLQRPFYFWRTKSSNSELSYLPGDFSITSVHKNWTIFACLQSIADLSSPEDIERADFRLWAFPCDDSVNIMWSPSLLELRKRTVRHVNICIWTYTRTHMHTLMVRSDPMDYSAVLVWFHSGLWVIHALSAVVAAVLEPAFFVSRFQGYVD